MCGIAGKIYLDYGEIKEKHLKQMADKIAHRGPDDWGTFISEDRRVGFANRRLAIIDLSRRGHQPFIYKSRYTITYNGEIYNYQEERKKLEKQGYHFRSSTDTEVILALYDRYKTRCLDHLRGMFAFAIYDKYKNIIFMARDRIGKKPFKYFFDGNVFIFASELKAIITQKEVKKEIDFEAIFDYLTFGYTISPNTGFKGINKLEPGHYLILDLNGKNLQKVKYWYPDYSSKLNLSENEWQKVILNKLNESVKLRMVADVPIGALLSGGVDSSTIVALMAKNSTKPINTFTVGFKDINLDESRFAKNVAKTYRTNQQTLVAEPTDVEILPDLARMYEEPFADASCVVTYMVCKLAKKYVTVILNGDGGDENFVGYDRFNRVKRDFLIDKYASTLKTPAALFGKLLLKSFPENSEVKRLSKFLEKSKIPFFERYGSYIEFFSACNKKGLYKNILEGGINSFEKIETAFNEAGNINVLDKTLYFDLTRYLPEDLLAKVDIASMGVGLEARSPFLDHKFVELACKIPFGIKFKRGIYKYILKEAIKELVPHENIYRRKIGFTIPLDRWFEDSLNNYTRTILLNNKSFTQKIFNKEFINNMLLGHSKNNDFGPRLWSLLSLELWYKAYF